MRLPGNRWMHRAGKVAGSKCGQKRGVVRVGVNISEEMLEMLKALAISQRRSVAGQIRHLLEQGMMR